MLENRVINTILGGVRSRQPKISKGTTARGTVDKKTEEGRLDELEYRQNSSTLQGGLDRHRDTLMHLLAWGAMIINDDDDDDGDNDSDDDGDDDDYSAYLS